MGPVQENGSWRLRQNNESYQIYKEIQVSEFVRMGAIGGRTKACWRPRLQLGCSAIEEGEDEEEASRMAGCCNLPIQHLCIHPGIRLAGG